MLFGSILWLRGVILILADPVLVRRVSFSLPIRFSLRPMLGGSRFAVGFGFGPGFGPEFVVACCSGSWEFLF